jgi:hypothetical protein
MHHVVITSIHPPTEGIRVFSSRQDASVVVVGDRKTPDPWVCGDVNFVSIAEQLSSGMPIGRWLPENHYSRKLLGYVRAMELGATAILDTDDDNVPSLDYGFPAFEGSWDFTAGNLGFVNVYSLFSDSLIWPRGHPLDLVKRNDSGITLKRKSAQVGIWQGLVNGDPDVDAVYRLTRELPVQFRQRDPIILDEGTVAPFNSQNTLFRSELFPLLYLPSLVTFRFTDILRGLVAQPIMWQFGYLLGFVAPNITQHRNEHDLMEDFRQELPMYEYGPSVVELVTPAIAGTGSIGEALRRAYEVLVAHGVVPERELEGVELWLEICGDFAG